MTHEQQLIRQLYVARNERGEAKKAFISASERLGECENEIEVFHADYGTPSIEKVPCYSADNNNNGDGLCEICAVKQPLYERYQVASLAAGAALRRVIAAGKKLSTEDGK